MNDEQFATSLRPDSVFGSLGASDFEGNTEEYGELAEGWGSASTAFAYDEPPSPIAASPSVSQPVQRSEMVAMRGSEPSQPSSGASAGLMLLLLTGGALAGWHYGRFKGAAGGALALGAARNLYLAQKRMRSESPEVRVSAVRPGLIGLVGLGGGGYLLYTAK
jgi:hypothetical protein